MRIYTFARFGETSVVSNYFRGFRWSLDLKPKGNDGEPKLGVSLRKMSYGDIYGENVPDDDAIHRDDLVVVGHGSEDS